MNRSSVCEHWLGSCDLCDGQGRSSIEVPVRDLVRNRGGWVLDLATDDIDRATAVNETHGSAPLDLPGPKGIQALRVQRLRCFICRGRMKRLRLTFLHGRG